MRIVVVCTGNIIRSPALAGIMQQRMPEHQWMSAAVGRKVKPGLRMRRPMRELMHGIGLGEYAEAHRSQLLSGMQQKPSLFFGVAPKHMQRLAELAPGIPAILTEPAIIDPVRGGPELYATAWMQILQAADGIESLLERE